MKKLNAQPKHQASHLGTQTGLIVALFLLLANVASASPQCTSLNFVPVIPQKAKDPAPVSCDSSLDKQACQIKEAFSKLSKVQLVNGKTAIRLAPVSGDDLAGLSVYLAPLLRSPAIRDVDALRIEAREIAGSHEPCGPNLIYLGDDSIFGMGPVFVDSHRFEMNGWIYTNFIAAEDASLHGWKLLSKKSLIADGYYDIVLAHELSHGIMQDLYGVDRFAKLADTVVSRDGHMASAVTDPALAWIEGFAEGFEAYLGEKYLPKDRYDLPRISELARTVRTSGEFFGDEGWRGYLFGALPFLVKDIGSTALNFDDFVSEFLIAERQIPIRENHYVMQGNLVNLIHEHGIFPAGMADDDVNAILQWKTEGNDALYSKEGVVAHIVYSILKQGMTRKMFEVIHDTTPSGLYAFLTAFEKRLSPREKEQLRPVLAETFTEQGRQALRQVLQVRDALRTGDNYIPNFLGSEKRYQATIQSLKMPKLVAPRSYWVEFRSRSVGRHLLYGSMDRINLMTATPGRLRDLALSGIPLGMNENDYYVGSEMHALYTARQADDITESLAESSMEFPMQGNFSEFVLKAHACFEARCLTVK